MSQQEQSTADSGDPQRPTMLRVAGLDGPPVGSGCCAISPEDLVLDELDS